MLVLTRRLEEVVMIGDDISVKILGISGNQIRLGIVAPADIPVHRQEIYDRIQREKEAEVLRDSFFNEEQENLCNMT